MTNITLHKTTQLFLRRWPVYRVDVDGDPVGNVHRTGDGEVWMNDYFDRTYYSSRRMAVLDLVNEVSK